MITLSDYQTEVNKIAAKSGLNSRIPLWLHHVEMDALSRHPFWFRVKSRTLTTTIGQATNILDSRVEGRRISKMNNETNDSHVSYDDLASALWSNPTPTESGTPYAYHHEGVSRVQNQPTSASVLSFTSTVAGDGSKVVTIRGISGGVDVVEELTLGADATVASLSTKSYTEIESITKDGITWSGTLTATSNSGGVTVVSIPPDELCIQAPKIRWIHVPSAAETIRYYFYERVRRMTKAYDIPMTPEEFQWKVLMNGLLAIAHFNNQDYNQAQMYEAKMEKGVRDMIEWGAPTGRVQIKGRGSPGMLRRLSDRYNGSDNDNYGTP